MLRRRLPFIGAAVVALSLITAQLYAQQATNNTPPAGKVGPWAGMLAQRLDLTPEQREKGKALLEKAKTDIKGVLTPEQQAAIKARVDAFKAGAEQRKAWMDRMGAFKPTEDQLNKLKAIRTDTAAKMKAVIENAALSREDKRKQAEAIIADAKKQAEAIIGDIKKQAQAAPAPAPQPAPQQPATPPQAQPGPKGPWGHMPGGFHARMQGMKDFADQLKITPDQKDKIKGIITQGFSDFRATLTPEQQAKFDKMKARFQKAAPAAPPAAP